MTIPEFSVKRRVTITMLMLIIVLGGVVSFFSLGLDLMPDMEFPMISVVTRYEGVAPEDIENLLTKPIEEACGSLKGMKNIYSTSLEGSSVVMIEFEWGTNLDFAAQDARESIDMMRMMIPSDADSSAVLKFDMSQMPVVFFGIIGLKDTMELREYIKDSVVPKLERLDGVASAMVFGGREREINVLINRFKLNAYGISMDEIASALAADNINVSAGQVTEKYTEYFVRTLGEYKKISDLENTIIRKTGDVPIYLKDIAEVRDSYKEQRDITRLNGKEAVLMMISKQSGANTVLTVDRVKKALDEMKETMPADIEFFPVMDQAHIIKKILKNTLLNALVGGVLAVFFLYAFLRNWRPTFGIFLAIPISIITTFIGLYLMGYTFNIFTLAGFALVVGMLVDNAVVVIENIFRKLEAGEERPRAAAQGATEVGMAITTSTLTTIAVFLPMVLSKGFAGQISRPLAMTVCAGLLSSLLVALTIVPMVASVLFKKRKKIAPAELEKRKFEKFKQRYIALLALALKRKKLVIFSALGVFFLSLFGLMITGLEFMPQADTPIVMMMTSFPVGTDLDETSRVVEQIAEDFMNVPEKMYVLTMIGRSSYGDTDAAMGTMPADVNEGMIMSRMVDLEKRKRTVFEISDELREKFPPVEGVTYKFSDMGSQMSGSMSQTPVELKLFGRDLDEMERYAKGIAERIKDVPGLRDVTVSLKEGKPEIQVLVDRDRAAHFGMRVSQIGKTVQTALLGKVATKYRAYGEETDVRIRFSEEDRDSPEDIANIILPAPAGQTIYLKDVAQLKEGVGPLKIDRENRLRKITIGANVANRSIGQVVADIKVRLADFPMAKGYFLEYGGTYKQMAETMIDLMLAFLAAAILIYMIMAAQFESLTQPFVIMFSIPMSIIGVIMGLIVMGMSFSVPAMMGVIILGGIVVNNGIVLVDYVNRLRKQGMEKHEAIIQAASARLRPILITALTTIMGILPMAFTTSQGAEMRAPLGAAVAFGLMASTILTLFVVPVMYSVTETVADRAQRKAMRKLHGRDES
ncbi:efflux RND transporter permease subunit [bacterium]|nr:efflux RND transporter permease subunit [Candidatus Omnitrophota bacterium]MBU3930001.1 efflux RND transporter permease subunit [bacterium]MBU4122955.1 efflux RND transporter permease subunit [bacterium]